MKVQSEVDKLVEGYRIPFEKNKSEAWEALQLHIQKTPRKKIIPIYRRNGFAIAASLLLAAVLFTFLADTFLTIKKYNSGAEQLFVKLPDDSKVTLSPFSELKVNYSFLTGKRLLKLSGEALFEVEQGKKFDVIFSGGKVEVLGTVFSVSAYKNSVPEVNCLEGKVKVETKNAETVLVSDTGIKLNTSTKLLPVKIESEAVLNELAGIYSWKNESLKTIFEKLENRFGYKIIAAESVKMRKFSGDINADEIENACDIVAFAMDLHFSVDKKTKTVTFEIKN